MAITLRLPRGPLRLCQRRQALGNVQYTLFDQMRGKPRPRRLIAPACSVSCGRGQALHRQLTAQGVQHAQDVL